MRLDFVEVCGFRGFRERTRINFGRGFTVISGRNGVGKSTIFDAVEFGLLGTINKYLVEKAAKESLSDYLWWRGEGRPASYYVRVGFIDDLGTPFTVTRSRETGADRTSAQIQQALCSGAAPDDALNQLCRTSILRDEWIAAHSVDLSDTDRFDLVRSALGPAEGTDYASKAKEVLSVAETSHENNTRVYEAARLQLTNALAQVAEARDTVARTGDVAAAIKVLTEIVPELDGQAEITAHLATGRSVLVSRRARLGVMGEAANQAKEILALREAFDSPDARKARDALKNWRATAATAKAEAERAAAQARHELDVEEQANAVATSLAALIEHGQKLGLHDDRCPLCAATLTIKQFEEGIALARTRLHGLASEIETLREKLAAAEEAAELSTAEFERADAENLIFQKEEEKLVAREQAHVELFEQHGLDLRFAKDPDGLELAIAKEREQLIELERALLTLESSQAVSRIATLEDRASTARLASEAASERVSQSGAALLSARSIQRAVRSLSGEIIDERLAQISPLLNELYERLRPHNKWRTIEYNIRGDVRRFLSLTVGVGLNPQFVFSSGQRRAAGLAFLLSVHLARSWTKWNSLLLDDPVQHIDDFRALHLTEVLAAFRLNKRQIICGVEDSSLADLLCRRLLSTSEQIGRRYDIDVSSDGASVIAEEADIPPMPVSVLRRGAGLQAVG